MKKSYKEFMIESSGSSKGFDVSGFLNKVKTELKGNKHVKSIIMSLGLTSDIKENIVSDTIGKKTYDYILKRVTNLYNDTKKDLQELFTGDSWMKKGDIVIKLLTRIYVVAIFFGVAVDEIEKIVKGKKEVKLIEYKKVEQEIKDIASKF